MARVFPSSPIGSITPEVAKVFGLLKQLPDKQYIVWHRLTIWDSPGPDFWVISRDRASVLMKVSTATRKDALAIIQPSLFQENSEPIGANEEFALQKFLKQAVHELDSLGGLINKISKLILFPNVSTKELDAALETGLAQNSPWIGNEVIKPETLEKALEKYLGSPMSDDEIRKFRSVFAPENVIPNEFTVREPVDRNTEATLTNFLFDYDQEWALKLDLDLEDTAHQAAKDFSVRLINGVAGSGKSLIIVYRAHLLAKHFPNKSILVLTHNKALIGDLKYRYNFLANGNQNVKWYTFLSWCYQHWPNYQEWVKPLGIGRRDRLIGEIWQECLADTAISTGMFRDEIDWYKDRLLFSRSDYLAADRTGRGFGLNEAMRNRMFDAIIKYEDQLKTRKQVDWGDIPRKVWEHINSRKSSIPEYDAILIDEAQFFAPIWFEIIKKILNPSQGHLFIVADPTQGFLKRRQSWLASGLEVRGRAHKLNKSYRTTRKILDFATRLYRARVPDDDEDIVVPDLLDMPVGVIPEIIPLTSPQDEVTRVTNEIVEVVKLGRPLEHILVIHPKWSGVERLLSQIGNKLGPASVADAKVSPRGNHIRVCTLNASAGLESPIVFLAGVKDLYEEEQSLRISDEERMELIRDNTRKLYMAITRAGQRLVITYAGELPDWLNNPLLQLKR